MNECIIRIQECHSGMVLAKDIFNENGSIILTKGTILTDSMIDKLIIHNINSIRIIDDNILQENSPLDESNSFDEIKKDYSKKINSLKNIFNNIAEGNEEDEIRKLSLSIIESTSLKGEMLRCMLQLRSIDEYTYTHSLNVASICYLIGEWMNLDKENLEDLVLAALLHDIGKTKISPDILNKTTALTNEEKIEIENHPQYGYELLKNNTALSKNIYTAILMHHERIDGSGYPQGLVNNDISLIAKIIGIADIYSAITLDRVYKRADTPFVVFGLFESSSAIKFDPLISYILISNIAKYYIGDDVMLSNKKTGRIIIINDEFPSRPIIMCSDNEIIDLTIHKNIQITKML